MGTSRQSHVRSAVLLSVAAGLLALVRRAPVDVAASLPNGCAGTTECTREPAASSYGALGFFPVETRFPLYDGSTGLFVECGRSSETTLSTYDASGDLLATSPPQITQTAFAVSVAER
jgi:hypothetical protein